MSKMKFVWHSTAHDLVYDLEPKVVQDLVQNLPDEVVNDPSMLISQVVFLSDDHTSGPVVHVWGKTNDNRFHCEYQAAVNWISLNESESDEQG